VSKASDDLPDPLTPVMMTRALAGSVRSMFLRLCVRAPRITSPVDVPAVGSDMVEGPCGGPLDRRKQPMVLQDAVEGNGACARAYFAGFFLATQFITIWPPP
jgi:hypothetical protein